MGIDTKYFDAMQSDLDIDERRIFCNGDLNLHFGKLPKEDTWHHSDS